MSVEDNARIKELEAELEKVRTAIKDANLEAKKSREEKEALQVKVEELSSDETVAKMQARIVKTEAKSRLIAEGVKDPDRVLKYLNSDSVKVTDDGLEGLDEVMTTVKKDFPELFDKKRQVGGSADAAASGSAPKMTTTEAQVQRLMSNVG